MTVRLVREAELAAEWDLKLEQFRILKRKHGWAHVYFSRNDIRYTEAQIEQIVHDMTRAGVVKRTAESGLTDRSARSA